MKEKKIVAQQHGDKQTAKEPQKKGFYPVSAVKYYLANYKKLKEQKQMILTALEKVLEKNIGISRRRLRIAEIDNAAYDAEIAGYREEYKAKLLELSAAFGTARAQLKKQAQEVLKLGNSATAMSEEPIIIDCQWIPATSPADDKMFVHVPIDELESEHIAAAPYSYWRAVFFAFVKRPAAIIGAVTLLLLIIGMIVFPLVMPAGMIDIDIARVDLKPSAAHILGCDKMGRDLFYAVWVGGRKSIILALIVSLINLTVGTIIGLIWGFFKRLDRLFIEIYNLISNIPALLLFMLLSFIFMQAAPLMRSEVRLVIALTLFGWVGLARFVRNQVLIITNREYNVASETLGTPAWRIMFKNLLPYISAVVITNGALMIPAAISSEVSMSFFGVGLPADTISIGAVLDLGRKYFQQQPYQLLAPAGFLALVIFSFYLIGLALADALNPKTHR